MAVCRDEQIGGLVFAHLRGCHQEGGGGLQPDPHPHGIHADR